VAIETGEVIEGTLPKDLLRANWRRARAGEQPERIAGLDVD
jgi:hypothetical protein